MASRELSDLYPALCNLAGKHRELCLDSGITLLIYCTFRSAAEQDDLYARGRSKPGRIITYCSGGQSKHNNVDNGIPAALAYDCVPMIGGKCVWDDDKLWDDIGTLGESIGLDWGGRWHMSDKPHFELDLNY